MGEPKGPSDGDRIIAYMERQRRRTERGLGIAALVTLALFALLVLAAIYIAVVVIH